MTNIVQVITGLFIIAVLFLPAAFLIYAAIKVSKISNGLSSKLLALGAVLLTISSLDILFTYFVAFVFDARQLADYAITANYIFRALNLVAMVSIGLGLIKLVSEINSREQLSGEPGSV